MITDKFATKKTTCPPQKIHSFHKEAGFNGLVESSHAISLHAIRIIFGVFLDALTFKRLCFIPATAVVAENLFLRKQLSLFVERIPILSDIASRYLTVALEPLILNV